MKTSLIYLSINFFFFAEKVIKDISLLKAKFLSITTIECSLKAVFFPLMSQKRKVYFFTEEVLMDFHHPLSIPFVMANQTRLHSSKQIIIFLVVTHQLLGTLLVVTNVIQILSSFRSPIHLESLFFSKTSNPNIALMILPIMVLLLEVVMIFTSLITVIQIQILFPIWVILFLDVRTNSNPLKQKLFFVVHINSEWKK
jgi:hypothetical protein